MLVDPRACLIFDTDEKGLEAVKEQMLAVNNVDIAGKSEDLVINTHVCRGNFHSTYASSGAYDGVAETLFERENVNAYYYFWSLATRASMMRRSTCRSTACA